VHRPQDPTNVEWQRYLNTSGEVMNAFATTDVAGAHDFLNLMQQECERAVVLLRELERDLADTRVPEVGRALT
jgi:hypothetical protein